MLTFLLSLARHLSTPAPAAPASTGRMAILEKRLAEIRAKQDGAGSTAPEIKWPLVLARLAASVWFTPLVALLESIRANDTNYEVRNPLVIQAVSMALRLGMAAGFRIDPEAPEWPVAYIELPTGQVSWHLPQHTHAFDGHTTEQKYERCRQLAEFALLAPSALAFPPTAKASQA